LTNAPQLLCLILVGLTCLRCFGPVQELKRDGEAAAAAAAEARSAALRSSMQSLAEQQAAHEVRDVMMRAQQAEACQQEASTQIIPNPVASTDFLQLLMVQCQLADRSL